MTLDPAFSVDLFIHGPEIENEVRERLERGWVHEIGFVAAWKLQSMLATLAFITFVALIPISLVLAIMVAWSLLAAFVYHKARQTGLPDLFADSRIAAEHTSKAGWPRFVGAVLTLTKACIVGLQPFIYCRTVGCLVRPANSLPSRVARSAALWIGLVLFGVTATHHLLSRAGYSGSKLLNLSYIGTVLNVSYRTVFSLVLVNLAMGIISL
jgi:hypothetical protein